MLCSACVKGPTFVVVVVCVAADRFLNARGDSVKNCPSPPPSSLHSVLELARNGILCLRSSLNAFFANHIRSGLFRCLRMSITKRASREEERGSDPYIMDRSIGDSQDSPLLQNTYLLYYTLRRTPKKDPKGRRGHHTSVYFLAGSIRGRPGRIRDSLRDPLRKHSLFVADLLVQGGDKKIAHVVDYTKWRP